MFQSIGIRLKEAKGRSAAQSRLLCIHLASVFAATIWGVSQKWGYVLMGGPIIRIRIFRGL